MSNSYSQELKDYLRHVLPERADLLQISEQPMKTDHYGSLSYELNREMAYLEIQDHEILAVTAPEDLEALKDRIRLKDRIFYVKETAYAEEHPENETMKRYYLPETEQEGLEV
ncbi:MAG: hypothetical protein FWE31_02170 [Firmicutes bacterium]|nr:hypothetical protein [Bacillota bacterium]